MKALIREQYRLKSSQLIDLIDITPPKEGWIRTVRKALGMSGPQLANRMQLSSSQISQMERLETQDRITLKQLKKAAEQLDCDVVYGLVPRRPLTKIIEEQAYYKAKKLVEKAHVHMVLENQQLSKEKLQEQVAQEVEKTMLEMPRDLWEE